jgi:hypothetical protein
VRVFALEPERENIFPAEGGLPPPMGNIFPIGGSVATLFFQGDFLVVIKTIG